MKARHLSVVTVLALSLALPSGATAAKSIIVYAASITIGATNRLELGWTVDGGVTRHVLVDNYVGTVTPASLAKSVTVAVSTADRTSFQVYLRDVSCDVTFLADGAPVDHVTSTTFTTAMKGRTMTDYYFSDAGGYDWGCPYAATTVTPTPLSRNGDVTILR